MLDINEWHIKRWLFTINVITELLLLFLFKARGAKYVKLKNKSIK